jgi:hypothetical protein
VLAELLQGGEGEGSGFARPGLGGSNDIPAFEGRWDRPELDRGGFPVAHGLDAFKKWLGQSKLGERHVRRGQSGRGGPLSISVGFCRKRKRRRIAPAPFVKGYWFNN